MEAADDQARARSIVRDVTAPGIDANHRQELYDKWAKDYDSDLAKVHYPGPKIQADQTALYLGDHKGALILDVAAGTGQAAERLHSFGYKQLHALDCNQAMLDVARSKNVYEKFICAFLGPDRLPIDDNTYDAISTTGSFVEGHVTDSCFPELIRILKPGGYLIIVMGESYLTDVPAYHDKLEPAMRRIEAEGHWKMMKREVVPKYREEWHVDDTRGSKGSQANTNGVVFVFQKTASD